uniref:TRUD domain-containing protein n=1 Tax=Alexandrium monilatum TaxID=311494 RepID=A0A7S4SHW8_9DINO
MTLPAALRFQTRALEADVGLHGSFLAAGTKRVAGALRSARVPCDLQRHEVGSGGEVLHLATLGLPNPPAASLSGPPVPRGAPAPRQRSGAAWGGEPARQPWSATLYARGQRPETARRVLAAALQVPQTSLQVRGALASPGVSVQLLRLPRGLPAEAREALRGPLRSGLLAGQDPLVAVGGATLLTPNASQPRGRAARRDAGGQADWSCTGHRYTVVVRDLDPRQASSGLVDESIERVCSEGFINFFELAAFGLAEVRRYEVGAALWAGRWDAAARLLLGMNLGGEGSALARASAAFRAGDLERGLELLPQEGAEGLRGLAMQLLLSRPALEALQRAVPRAVWVRHLSAVSRLAWNHAAAVRLTQWPRRPIPGDLIWDERAGEARPLGVEEVEGRHLSEVVLPLPRPGEPVPECTGRLRLEATLNRLAPGDGAPVAAFPLEVSSLLPRARAIVGVPADVSWDISKAGPGPIVDCDLARLGADPTPDSGGPGRGARAGGRRSSLRAGGLDGMALRLRFSLPRGGSAEAVLREVLHANPSEFCEGLGRRDEVF